MKNFKHPNKIPWQAVVVVVIHILILIGSVIAVVQHLTAYALAFIILQDPGVGAKFIGSFPVQLGVPLFISPLSAFLITSVAYGKRWGMLILLSSQIFIIFSGFFNFFKLLFSGEGKLAIMQFVGMFLLFEIFWLIWSSLQHPYYGGDGRGYDFKTWAGWKEFFLGRRNRRGRNSGEELTTF